MKNLWHFLQYHNAVPITLGIIFLGAGATFAATNPQAIYSQTEQVVAIDNTYLVNKDLSTYSPQVQITGVTEDSDNYYVAYNLSTIDIVDAVWKDVVKPETMTVSKADLGPYRDLGVYVTQQLKQNVDREKQRLAGTQDIERKQVSQKVVATTYGGLVGKMLNDTTETLPGYTPVVQEPQSQVAAAAAGGGGSNGNTGSAAFPTNGISSGNPSLRLQLLGNNPAQIPLKTAYVDLGAIATDAQNDNIRIETYLDGAKVPQVQIDTSTTTRYVVRYVALDPRDNSASVERIIYVYDPAVGPPVPEGQVQNAGTAPLSPPVAPLSPNTDTAATPPATPPADSGGTGTATAATTSTTTTPSDTAAATSTETLPATTTPDIATSSPDTSASSTPNAATSTTP